MCDYVLSRRRNKKPKSKKTDPLWSKKQKNNSSRSRFDEKGRAWCRFHEKRFIHDEIKYSAVDQAVVSDITASPWKTNAPFYTSMVPNGPNSNQHNECGERLKIEEKIYLEMSIFPRFIRICTFLISITIMKTMMLL